MPREARNLRLKAKDILDSRSMHGMPPFLVAFLFVGSKPSLDIYQSFTVKPLHLFHLGISRMLKQCMSGMLLSKERFRGRPVKGAIYLKSFSCRRNEITKQLNRFVVDVTTITNEYPSALAWLNVDGRAVVKGYSNDDGFFGMLENMNIGKLDNI